MASARTVTSGSREHTTAQPVVPADRATRHEPTLTESDVPPPSAPGPWPLRDWVWLGGLALCALGLRVLFFTGYFGSDDINYTNQALAVSRGEWPVARYLSGLRYGITGPSAFFIRLFGFSPFVAALWSLLASVAEVALVFVFARRLWSTQAALLSGIFIALCPLHIHYGGLVVGDAPLAFFITLSVVCFFYAVSTRRGGWHFAAGLAMGATFWVKEFVVPYFALFPVYVITYRVWTRRLLWLLLGVALMIGANALLFKAITGDALYYFKVMAGRRQVFETLIATDHSEYLPPVWFYLTYMFVKIWHTWLLFYFALGGLLLWARAQARGRSDPGTTYVVVWAVTLFAIFTFFVMKLRPLTFIFKQTNYMLIFLAPFALLAGYFAASLPRGLRVASLALFISGSLVLAALEQQTILVFTANSKAAWAFVRDHPRDRVYDAGHHLLNMADVLAAADGTPRRAVDIRALSTLTPPDPSATVTAPQTYVIVDLETAEWSRSPVGSVEQVPACWEQVMHLHPPPSGAGAPVVAALGAVTRHIPGPAGPRLVGRLARLSAPQPG